MALFQQPKNQISRHFSGQITITISLSCITKLHQNVQLKMYRFVCLTGYNNMACKSRVTTSWTKLC